MDSDLHLQEDHDRIGNDGLSVGGGSSISKKLFKCAYCSVVSRWNRRDISLHILHVHLHKRVYTCQYCSYGSSKSSTIVMSHCNKIHPQRPISVRDELALFNAIAPIQDDGSSLVVPVAYVRSDGLPILELADLRKHLGLRAIASDNESSSIVGEKRRTTSSNLSNPSSKRSHLEEQRERDQPLDLTVRLRSSDQRLSAMNDNGSGDYVNMEYAEWKCKLCRFRNRSANHVKRHILCHHMRLKPFSCPVCSIYQWKAQAVSSHIDKFHPGVNMAPVSTAVEKAAYLSRNMAKVLVRAGGAIPEMETTPGGSTLKLGSSRFTGVSSTPFYRCKQCGYQEIRHDKTKYHVIKQHLKLGLFSCPHCLKYLWGRNYVARHIRTNHPGMEVRIRRTFDEYADYLKENIKKIGGSTVESSARNSRSSADDRMSSKTIVVVCDVCYFTADSEAALASHKRSHHKSYSCLYCDYKDTLAAKVQSHCLRSHPTKPVQYRDRSDADDVSTAQIKMEISDDEVEEITTSLDDQSRGGGTTSPPAPGTPLEMYMCRYCHHLLWNMEEMMAHLCESHPDEPPEFEFMQEPRTASANAGSEEPSCDIASEITDNCTRTSVDLCEIDDDETENDEANNNDDDDDANDDRTRSSPVIDADFIYKCKLCTYHTDKVTVMRHHVMSHLLYHPYRCPYCETGRSVKSSPITKHIRLKHPGLEPRFISARDEEMEEQVRSTYYRTVRDGTESTTPVKSFRNSLTIPPSTTTMSRVQKLSRRAFYKCKFCSLVTHIRTDMRHHLMREVHYKPFICGYCNYTEPSRSGMGKHFRSKHCGMVVDIRCVTDEEQEVRVEKMLDECIIRHDPENSESVQLQVEFATRRNEPFKLLSKKTLVDPNPTSRIEPTLLSTTTTNRAAASRRFPAVSKGRAQNSAPPGAGAGSRTQKMHHCTQCSYSSTSLRPLQAHMVKHRPCRLQCAYCSHKSHYPSWIRKHIRSSHPAMAFKYCKVVTPESKSATNVVKRELPPPDDPLVLSIPSLSTPPPAPLPPTPPSTISRPVSKLTPFDFSQTKKLQKTLQGPAMLDGVELDIALIPGKDGYYRCPECEYHTANRSHYKMHSVIHKPRKWKCFYCNHRFPLVFRLRRHCSLRHPRLVVKWVDVETGQVCDDFTPRPRSFFSYSSYSSSSSTARKSLSLSSRQPTQRQRTPLTVAMFRSFKPRTKTTTTTTQGQHDEQTSNVNNECTIDLDDDDNDCKSTISVDLESNDNDDDDSSESSTPGVWFCCPKCPKKYAVLRAFVDHVNGAHASAAMENGGFPILEILPPIGEGELTLQRCGFCPFESFFKDDFDNHVRQHTTFVPIKCGHCTFASFLVSDVEIHSTNEHPQLPLNVSDLDQPYTMTFNDIPEQQQQQQQLDYSFDPTVKLVDVCKVLQEKWEEEVF